MMHAIELKNVSVVYGEGTPFRKVALDNITLGFEEKTITGVIGHTGSGKSTLATLLNGLLAPTSGTVMLHGTDIWARPKEGGSSITASYRLPRRISRATNLKQSSTI